MNIECRQIFFTQKSQSNMSRPFNHIFEGDRILRAWYRGIKNAGPRKRAQGRAQDIQYQSISPYHHGIWRIFLECGKKNHARKGEAQGVLSYQKVKGIFDNPHVIVFIWSSPKSVPIHYGQSMGLAGPQGLRKKRGNTPWMAIHESPSSRWSSSTMTSWSSRIWLDRCICHRKRLTSWGRVTVTCRTVWQFGLLFFVFKFWRICRNELLP